MWSNMQLDLAKKSFGIYCQDWYFTEGGFIIKEHIKYEKPSTYNIYIAKHK